MEKHTSNQRVLSRIWSGRKNSQAGFTIIEVLVSITIFAIGLIGVARLQVVAKQSNHDAVQRVTATSIAQDLVSRMRANSSALSTYVENDGAIQINYNDGTSEPSPNCSSSTCNDEELALHDLWEIEQDMIGITEQDADGNPLGGLVLPTICITAVDEAGNVLDDGSSGIYTVAIAWRGKAGLSNPTINTCGDDTGLYGNSNQYRRLLSMSTYISTM